MQKFIPILLFTFSIQAQTIKAKNENGVLHVPIKINSVLRVEAMIDTGAAECSLPPCIANTLIKTNTLLPKHLLPSKVYSLADGSTQECKRFTIKSLKIGNQTVHDIECSVAKSDNAPMLIGVSALKKLKNIRINYKNNTLILVK